MTKEVRRISIHNRDIDFKPAGLWSHTIALCFAPRTGSNLLARYMWRTGVLGAPQEYFNYDADMLQCAASLNAKNVEDYVAKLAALRTSPNGVFATKLLPGHWEMLKMSRSSQIIEQATVVMTTRKDVVAQAVSMHIAEKSGAWTSDMSERAEIAYDYQSLADKLNYIEDVYRFWATTLSRRTTPFIVAVYENFTQNPDRVIATISRVMKIPLNPAAQLPDIIPLKKQATARNEDWAERFRADMAERGRTLSPSPFAAIYQRMDKEMENTPD